MISIRAPPAGGGIKNIDYPLRELGFQSAPPVRGATAVPWPTIRGKVNFNPRPPCGGRLQKCTKTFLQICHTSQIIY